MTRVITNRGFKISMIDVKDIEERWITHTHTHTAGEISAEREDQRESDGRSVVEKTRCCKVLGQSGCTEGN